jgi:TonB family protein
MAAGEALHVLLALTLASSLGITLALALRRPMRYRFGAGVGYATWLLVPLMMAASQLPASPLQAEAARALPALGVPSQAASAAAAHLSAATGEPAAGAALALWLLGAALVALVMTRTQRGFLHRLGELQPRDSAFVSRTARAGLPATLGLWRPRIVLPHDFETRFDPEQRALMLAHERCHIAHGDPWINALAAFLCCAFWFNPLFHFAAARLRQDQELACDAAVLATRPQDRRRYGEALLHVQMTGTPAALGCHFGFCHPLRERILMLRATPPSRLRRRAGLVLLTLAAALLTTAVWAVQGSEPSYQPVREIQDSRQNQPPRYPAEAVRDGIGGSVTVLADIDERGRVVGARIDHSEPEGVFDAAALQAVVQWRFEPATRGGVAIREQIRIPITFSLHEQPDTAAN